MSLELPFLTALPAPGQQFRFHVNMDTCIGCKCCVVACNEQNGNPASINWRRVSEIEGGYYPSTQRSYLSMGCNHCVEPTCLQGCPVDAYSKDGLTGIVLHSADTCIGCQYCTWNCSYGVPQYNPARGVVGKCDMCHGRLALGQAPACVSACPEGAIGIEVVDVDAWRAAVAHLGVHEGKPVDDGSLSTTRVTLPRHVPPDARPIDLTHVKPEHPHWPLVVMTVLTQLSVGAFITIWVLQLAGTVRNLGVAALASLTISAIALGASTLHLGRPIHAYRALKMWRRSWLSREVLLFTAFAGVAAAYSGMLWLGLPGGGVIGGLTGLLGLAGVMASAYIYRVPARPAWNTPFTPTQFMLTAAVLGPLFAAAIGAGDPGWLAAVSAAGAGIALVVLALRFLQFTASGRVELQGTARLLSTVLSRHLVARGALLAMGGIVLPLIAAGMGPAADAMPGLKTRPTYDSVGTRPIDMPGLKTRPTYVVGTAGMGIVPTPGPAAFDSAQARPADGTGVRTGIHGLDVALTAVATGFSRPDTLIVLALLLALGAEVLGRYLFFVSVVPTHMAAPYLSFGREAA